MSLSIRSGGQTGVDRAALDVVAALGRHYGGWCPKDGWAEDCPTPPGIRARFPRLQETPSIDPRQRTAWNVRDSDATLVLINHASTTSPGTEFTRVCGELIFQRPILVVRIDEPSAMAEARRWLDRVGAGARRSAFVLNVAGPRESEAPGIAAEATNALRELLGFG